jgi:hypothetical protein
VPGQSGLISKIEYSLSWLNGGYFVLNVQFVRKVAVRLLYVDLVDSIEVPVECAVVLLYSVVKQRLKNNTGKVCN